MLTIEEIEKELEAGNTVDLECVDEDSFIAAAPANRALLGKCLAVYGISEDGEYIFISANFITSESILNKELKFFRIKRPTPTFNDLIDVAVQAVRNEVLLSLEFTNSSIHYISRYRLPKKIGADLIPAVGILEFRDYLLICKLTT